MTSIIKLLPLSGVHSEDPHCYILQVDEFRFLLDCGWDETFNMTHIKELKKHIHQIDAVLLSYPDTLHLGALPYVVGKCNLDCPIYSTIPVYKMGQMFMYDLFQSRHNTEDFDLFTLDDVDAAFDKIIQLKYSQTISLKGKGQGISITPLPGGHMIGGTIWKIFKDGEEDIIYAVDFNHKKERHLNGCILESVSRPSLLITDSYNANYVQLRRRLRDEQLMTNVLQTLRNSGNVLIAVDTAGRVLELAHMMDQLWRSQDSGLMAYSLALLNNVSYNVVEFAKSQVEWMSDKIMRSFEGARSNPFQFKHLQLCHSLGELNKVPEPKVVLASMPGMECGFSRELFIQWSGNPRNSIILTSRSQPGTLGRSLIESPDQKTVELQISRRVRLEGAELEEHLRREKEKELEAARHRAEKEAELGGSDSSEESEDEMEVDKGGNARHDLMMKIEGKPRGGGFFKQAKKSYPMFPIKEEKIKWDDYGEIIKLEDYMILEPSTLEEENKENKVENDDAIQDITEVPTKCISFTQTLDIRASVQFIDFEGRSDSESIKKILSLIKPRRLIIVRGPTEATESLSSYCLSGTVQGKVFTPHLLETVDATTESHIYQVKLKDSLVSSLDFVKSKDVELAWVDGEIVMEETIDKLVVKDEEILKDENEEIKEEDEAETDRIPVLQPLPLQQITTIHPTIFINEVKLSDFKQVLMRHGINAEFSGGVLYCNDVVALRKNESGHIHFEGTLTEDYFKVRDLLYEQYAII
ncbi:cleavage and polyadenylation specificity factor subunit 2-like [Uloborus diversus]|uniref:cleavage and polyadenylation specificity factor subunit 2-like n=1 Tax=Uloborus diversus TaxID=327109 RepID=UPI00240A23D8|nr:cleavage and polyadenylation specificity factor subunit 2-like [Uloborus diversus]